MGDWLQLVASFAFVLGLLALVLWGLRRMQHSKAFGRKDAQLQLVDTLSVGPRQKIILLRVRDQELVVGVGPHGMTALGAPADVAAQASSAVPPSAGFAQTLAGMKGDAS